MRRGAALPILWQKRDISFRRQRRNGISVVFLLRGEGGRARAERHSVSADNNDHVPRPRERRRNLVIVRAGDSSLHPMWLDGAADRSWDLLVSYFGADPEQYRRGDVIRVDSKGPKWPALRALIESHWDYIAQYEYIWLPDDDIACGVRDIDSIFSLSRDYRLHLSQPALSLDSHFSWIVTLRNPLLRVRFTNFVEIMVPCFERDFLARCLPYMSETLSGWGLDHLWPTMLQPGQMAIIDAAPVTHTRPLGGANYGFLKDRGITAQQECDEFRRAHAIGKTIIRTDAIETRGGRKYDHGSARMSALLRWGYGYALARAYVVRSTNRQSIRKQVFNAIASPAEFVDW